MLLVTGVALLLFGCVLLGWCMAMSVLTDVPLLKRPFVAKRPITVPLSIGMIAVVLAIILLFAYKWFAGLIGIVVGFAIVQIYCWWLLNFVFGGVHRRH
jgi:peptidoglycan biosynthesis protein MviN/MurJ (putative lipid II flippase)